MNLITIGIIISVMAAMVVTLPFFYWGIPWFIKKVSNLTKTEESPNESPFKRLCLRSWRTFAAIFIVLWGTIAALFMVIWRIFKFFLVGYQPDPPPGKRHA